MTDVMKRLLARLPDKSDIPMWKSFLQSIALLAIAMMAALYSTGAARSGDMVAAVSTALFSLVIAAWVGARLVPRLARGVDWTWMPSLNQIKITRDGGVFFGALVVVLLAAINTSNNLLYMVLSALVAVLLLSALLSAANFKHLQVQLLLPSRTFARESFSLSVRIHNPRRFFPVFSLFMEPQDTRLYFQVIPPRETALRSAETHFARRGRHTLEKLKAESRFPFGFFFKSHHYAIGTECICYPEILPQDRLQLSVADILGAHQRLERGVGNDLHSIRQYVSSDSARHVHWKASAKTASLKTREFANEDSRHIELAFDRYGAAQDYEQFETLVSQAASIAFHLVQEGAQAVLFSDEWESPSGGGENTLDAILRYLAFVEMSPTAAPPKFDPQSGTILFSLREGRRQSRSA